MTEQGKRTSMNIRTLGHWSGVKQNEMQSLKSKLQPISVFSKFSSASFHLVYADFNIYGFEYARKMHYDHESAL